MVYPVVQYADMIEQKILNYKLPEKLIARQPAIPRDSSRLFVYDTKSDKFIFDNFYHLHNYIPEDSLMVFNKTKVLPARIKLRKISGGSVTALFLVNEFNRMKNNELGIKNEIRIFVDRKVTLGERLFFNPNYYVTVVAQQEHIFTVQFDFSITKLFSLLEKSGTMPIPLYIKNSPLNKSELREKYQTVFAQNKGSAAAPTASLHFTNRLFKKLENKGINKEFITLHVGMGTFAPVTDEQFEQKILHEEWYEVEEETFRFIDKSKAMGKKIVAVGTTVVRTLESMSNITSNVKGQRLKMQVKSQKEHFFGKTDLFIYPPYQFKFVDHMITNFHLPGSSLMMLVEAFLQHKGAKHSLVDLYKIAIKNNFRFYSFGDGMLIL